MEWFSDTLLVQVCNLNQRVSKVKSKSYGSDYPKGMDAQKSEPAKKV